MKIFLIVILFMSNMLWCADILKKYDSMDISDVNNVIALFEFEKESVSTLDALFNEFGLYSELMTWRQNNQDKLDEEYNQFVYIVRNSNHTQNNYISYFLNNTDYYVIYYAAGGYVMYATKNRMDNIKQLDPENHYIYKDFEIKILEYLDTICDDAIELYCGDFSVPISFVLDELDESIYFKEKYQNEFNQLLNSTRVAIKDYEIRLLNEYEDDETTSKINSIFNVHLKILANIWLK